MTLCTTCAVKANATDLSCNKFGTDVTKTVCRIYERTHDERPPHLLDRQKVIKLASTYGYVTVNGFKKFTDSSLVEFCEALIREKDSLYAKAGQSNTFVDVGVRGMQRDSEGVA